jgi:signal peptidase II
VVDFISTPWMMPAIYNVADIFIVTMMIGVAILVLVGLRFDGTRERKADAASDDDRSDADQSDEPPTTADRDPLFPVADPDVAAPPRSDDLRRD